jgi:hypothetical protein
VWIINYGGKEINGLNQGSGVVEFIDPGIIAGF